MSVELDSNLTAVVSLWLGGLLLAAAWGVNRPRLVAGASAVLAVAAGLLAAIGLPLGAWMPCVGLATASLIASVVRRHRHQVVALLAQRWTPAAAFLISGPVFACAWIYCIEQSMAPRLTEAPPGMVAARPELTATSYVAVTNRGRSIPLFTADPDGVAPAEVRRQESSMANLFRFGLIRTAPADPAGNCHGWVFTDGRYWIRGGWVETILQDNGYTAIEKPRSGDVIVYRDNAGTISHTGIVRVLSADVILIESKWGHLGRFVHPPADQPYGKQWSFHRRNGSSHVMAIRSAESTSGAVAQ